jgi:pilus assembly protein CpaE
LDRKKRPVGVKLRKIRFKSRGSVAKEEKNAEIIAVFGSKGGVGKTTIAVNLATALSEMGKRTALLDFDLQFGDASIFLDLENKQGISELVQEGSITRELIRSYLLLHKTGLSLLSSSDRPEYAEMVQSSHGESIISGIAKGYDFVFIDLSTQMNDLSLMALEKADKILHVINPDISTLRNAKKTLELMKALKLDHKMQVVLNKENSSSITAKEISALMNMQFLAKIPVENKHAVASLNRGIPVVINVPRCPMSKRLIGLAKKIGEGNYGFAGKA